MEMVNMKKQIVRLVVLLMLVSGSGMAQDKQPAQAIVASFKQKIQSVLSESNAARGIEHAQGMSWLDDHQQEWVLKDGSPCDNEKHKHCKKVEKSVPRFVAAYQPVVEGYGMDVQATDSLVTPYKGLFSYMEIVCVSEPAFTKEALKEAVKGPGDFHCHPMHKVTEVYGFQDGQWNYLSGVGEGLASLMVDLESKEIDREYREAIAKIHGQN
jgi:hypothetical protein